MKDEKDKICKVSDAVQQLTLSKPFILETIATKTINYTKMADYLLPEIEELVDERPSLPAVNMALRRYAQKYMDGEFGSIAEMERKSDDQEQAESSYQITLSNGYCGLSGSPDDLARLLQHADDLTEMYSGIGIDGRTYLFINGEAASQIKQKMPSSVMIEESCIRISISADSNPISTAERFSTRIEENRFPFSLIQLSGSRSTVFCRTADLAIILG